MACHQACPVGTSDARSTTSLSATGTKNIDPKEKPFFQFFRISFGNRRNWLVQRRRRQYTKTSSRLASCHGRHRRHKHDYANHRRAHTHEFLRSGHSSDTNENSSSHLSHLHTARSAYPYRRALWTWDILAYLETKNFFILAASRDLPARRADVTDWPSVAGSIPTHDYQQSLHK